VYKRKRREEKIVAITRVGSRGRTYLPKSLLDELGLEEGSRIVFMRPLGLARGGSIPVEKLDKTILVRKLVVE